MADAINAALMKNRFYEQLEHYRRSRPPKEVVSINDRRYQEILEDIPNAKASKNKSDHELWLLKHYEILKIKDTYRLIDPHNRLIYLADGELFDALHEIHVGVGHIGRSRMSTVLRTRYKNITRNVVELYCDLCEQCKQKPAKVQPVPRNITRGQSTLIDFQTNPDGAYNFLLVYQDYLTKFIILKPLETNNPNEVAFNLLDIFSVFGAPAILSYYNNIDFIKQIIDYFRQFQKFKIIYGDYKSSKDQTYMENIISDISSKIEDWMQQNNASHWSIGLSFIQLLKNRDYNYDILQQPYKALFGKTIKLGLVVNNPNSLDTDVDLKKALTGNDIIEIKNDNTKNQTAITAPNVTIPGSKKSKKQKKINRKKSSATELLYDAKTSSDSMCETHAATKSIIESLNDISHTNCNKLPASDAIINTYPVVEEVISTHNVPVSSVMDVDPTTIIMGIAESEPLLNDNSTSTTNVYSAQETINDASTESTMDISEEETIVPTAPIFEAFDASTKVLPISEVVYNISSSESMVNPLPLEQTMGVYSSTVPVFNIYSEPNSIISSFAEPILNSDIIPQSIILPCSESFQDTNLILQDSALPSTQSIITTFPAPQSLGDTNFSLTHPLITNLTSADSLLNVNFNLPQSITSSFPSTQLPGNTNFPVPQSVIDTLSSSQPSLEDTTFTLPQSNISFFPLTHTIITSTPSSLESSHFTIPQPTITYLSSTPLMSGTVFSLPQSVITSFPSHSFQNINYNSVQSNINPLSSSLPMKDTTLTFSQSIMTAPSTLQAFSDGHFTLPSTMVTTLPALQNINDLNSPQSINNMIPTPQSFQNCNYISPQTIITTLPPLQPLEDVNLTLPQSAITLSPPQVLDHTNVILSHPIITPHPASLPMSTSLNPLDSSQDINLPEEPSDTNSVTSSVINNNNSQISLKDQATDTSTDLKDNDIQNNLYCPNLEPLIITIPGAENYDQTLLFPEPNSDNFSALGYNPNIITPSTPIIIPLSNFDTNFFQALPILESNYYQ